MSVGDPSKRVHEVEPADLSGFAERLLAVIDEGRRTATYKLAVLLALMDCCAEQASPEGRAPTEISTRAIARSVARLYWPQLRPFPTQAGVVELRQITNKSATILAALAEAFQALPHVSTWETAESVLPADHVRQVLDVVELTVARYPLVRLQTVDGVPKPFIYDIEWGEGVTLSRLASCGGATVRFRPGAGDQLVRLAPLTRPLVELHWVRMVADLNRLSLVEDDLHRHLFGAERVAFPGPLRHALADLQMGKCFYCRKPLTERSAVDHFIPWSRWPNDAVENLVIAHASCNSHKSDHIPGPLPLDTWVERLVSHSEDLVSVASSSRWRSDCLRSVSLARSLYAHLPNGAVVWNAPGHVDTARADQLLEMLAPL
jgi:5-methylcytosine-specific restriction endonuclease McrA